MKKRIISLTAALAMSLSLFSFNVNASEELTLAGSNIMTNAINLEFSEDVSSLSASLGGMTVESVEKVGDNAKLWTVKIDGKMDMTKKYILDFTADAANGNAEPITAKKAISFEVLRNDDFTDRTQFANIDAVKESYKMMTSNNQESGAAADTWAAYQLTEKGLEIHNSNATLMPVGFGYLNKYGNCYTVEADMGEFTSGAKAKIWFDNYMFYGADGNFNFDMCVLNNGVEFKNAKCKGIFGADKYNFDGAYDPITVAIATSADASNAANAKAVNFTLAAQGKTYIHKAMEMTDAARYVGINATNGTYNLKALRIYKSSMKDVTDFKVEDYEMTSQFIRVNLSAAPAAAGTAKITSCGADIPVTSEISGNTVIVKPADGAFPLDREILFALKGITDETGQTADAEKNFKFKKFWAEDFEGYTSIDQMSGYTMVLSQKGDSEQTNFTMEEVAQNDLYKDLYAIDTEEDGNKRLKITNARQQVFTHFENYPQRSDWKDCILEVDVEAESANKYSLRIMQNMNSYTGIPGTYYIDWSHNMLYLEGNSIKAFNYGSYNQQVYRDSKFNLTKAENKFIIGPQSGNMVTYVNGDIALSYPDRADSEKAGAEFGFVSLYDSTHYIDNIKMYKAVELSGGQTTVMSAMKNTENGGISGDIYIVNYDKAVGAAKLIVAVYDSENRLIGASMTDTEGLEKYKGTAKPYNIECTADDTANAEKVRAFWWSGFETLEAIAVSDSYKIN